MADLRALTELASLRFADHLARLGASAPPHRVEFSRRMTESWALIYYQRRLVRLSAYIFLLEPAELPHGSHWKELDATLAHEAAHAHAFALRGETTHTPAFRDALTRLGFPGNGQCDLGPENAAFRYVYACGVCGHEWRRRQRLRGNHSCGHCAPGRFSPEHLIRLREVHDLAWRLRARGRWVEQAYAEARHAVEAKPHPEVCGACDGSSSSGTRPQARPASPTRTSLEAAAGSTSSPAAFPPPSS